MLKGENKGTFRVNAYVTECARMNLCVRIRMTAGQRAVAKECGVAERRLMMEAVVTQEAWDQL